MAQPKLPGGLERLPRVEAEVRKPALPRLERPVGAVRHGAAGHEPGELRAGVLPADVGEPAREGLAVRPPPTGVVHAERDLRLTGRGVAGVERAPHEHAPLLAFRPVADERLALRVDAQRDVLRIPGDQLGRARAGRNRQGRDQAGSEDGAPHRRRNRQHRRKDRALGRGIRREPVRALAEAGSASSRMRGRTRGARLAQRRSPHVAERAERCSRRFRRA